MISNDNCHSIAAGANPRDSAKQTQTIAIRADPSNPRGTIRLAQLGGLGLSKGQGRISVVCDEEHPTLMPTSNIPCNYAEPSAETTIPCNLAEPLTETSNPPGGVENRIRFDQEHNDDNSGLLPPKLATNEPVTGKNKEQLRKENKKKRVEQLIR